MGDHDGKKRDRKEDRERRHHHEREMTESLADEDLPDEVTEAEACEQTDEDARRDKKKDKKKDSKEPKAEYAGHPEFAARLTEMVRTKGGDGYSLAFELTKLYIATGQADAKRVPGLFASLFEMFEFGIYPSSSKK